jgi:hypothetical protein
MATHPCSQVRLAATLLLAVGCGDGGSDQSSSSGPPGGGGNPDAGVNQPPPTGGDPETPLFTLPGTPIGDPVMATIDGAGGTLTEPMTGAQVKVAAGTFATATTVTLAPVTNTFLVGGLGDGVQVTTADAPAKPIFVTMPYGAEVSDPSELGLAAQNVLWYSLVVRVDPAAKTVTAALPTSFPVPGLGARPAGGAGASATVVKRNWTNTFRILPTHAVVMVGRTQVFTPVALAEKQGTHCADMPCSGGSGDDCLLATPCPVDEVDFTNDKAGFGRSWYVNQTQGGDGDIGTIVPTAAIGGTYTAPAHKPSPDPVTIMFVSVNFATGQAAKPSAPAVITTGYHVTGDATLTGTAICAGGLVQGTIADHFELDLKQTSPTNWDGSNYVNPMANACPPPWITAPGFDPARTAVATCDYVTVNNVVSGLDPHSETMAIQIFGTTQYPDCIIYPLPTPGQPPPPPVPLMGVTTQEEVLFDMDIDGAGIAADGTQVLSSGPWTLTVTELN